MGDVLRDEAALLSVGKDRGQRHEDFAHHCRRSVLAQPVLEGAHHRHGELREPGQADERCDVQVEMLPVPFQRRALDASGLAAFDPQPASLGDGDAPAVGGVDAGTDVDGGLGVVGVGVLLAGEGLDVPVAELVGIIHDPGFADFAVMGLPCALAHRHCRSPLCWNISEHRLT
jgi:hypothetical protein